MIWNDCRAKVLVDVKPGMSGRVGSKLLGRFAFFFLLLIISSWQSLQDIQWLDLAYHGVSIVSAILSWTTMPESSSSSSVEP